jgi:hypothetical protein
MSCVDLHHHSECPSMHGVSAWQLLFQAGLHCLRNVPLGLLRANVGFSEVLTLSCRFFALSKFQSEQYHYYHRQCHPVLQALLVPQRARTFVPPVFIQRHWLHIAPCVLLGH